MTEDEWILAQQRKWDRRFLEQAAFIARCSKDPSTKIGAIIVDTYQRVISQGFNGLPRGVHDYPDRYLDRNLKYDMVVHGEMNAILFAPRSCIGATLYTYPFSPCSRCAAMVIQAGIARVVAPTLPPELQERWEKSVELTKFMFREAGVQLKEYKFTLTMMVQSEVEDAAVQ